MKSGTAVILFVYLFAGCSNEITKKSGAPLASADARAQNDGSVEMTAVAATLTSLPSCTRSSAGMVGYVTTPTPGKF